MKKQDIIKLAIYLISIPKLYFEMKAVELQGSADVFRVRYPYPGSIAHEKAEVAQAMADLYKAIADALPPRYRGDLNNGSNGKTNE